VADLHGVPLKDFQRAERLLLLLGNEGKGVSDDALKLGQKLTIPMQSIVESLNVATAASILMYNLREAQ